MKIPRRSYILAVAASAAALVVLVGPALRGVFGGGIPSANAVTKYVRFQLGNTTAYGVVEGNEIVELSGDLYGQWQRTPKRHPMSSVKLLYPSARPSKVLALAGNYRSHLGTQPASPHPEIFIKAPSALQHPDGDIVIPPGTNDVHFEAELVIVIGKRAKNVSEADAMQYVLGITCGNDVSARDWQKNDRQWWRAKACDTFAPCGPVIVSGINYDDLLVTLRLNGEVKQQQRTKDLIHGVAPIVSFISRHMTLEPGDLIYTGTPGETSAMKPGDMVEVELEGVGVLRNRVTAAQ